MSERTPRDDRREDRGPRPVRESLDAAVRHIAPHGAREFAAIFGRWEELVGAAVAAHVQPLRATDEALVVAADHPAWATQVRALAPTLLAQIATATGRVPARLEVVVRRR
jgi:predicted nucleic acid-binding Zn ribbon protein